MIGKISEFDQFITDHRWAVLTTMRKTGQPVSSVVAYARDGDALVVSTPGTTFKRKSLETDDHATLCIITNQEPFNFVSVEGSMVIETTELVDNTRLVFRNIADTDYQEPEDLEQWLISQERVILRLNPSRVYGVIR